MSQEPFDRNFDRHMADLDRRLMSAAAAGDEDAALSRTRARVREQMAQATLAPKAGAWWTRLALPAAILLPVGAAVALGLALLGGQHSPAITVPAGASPTPTSVGSPEPSPTNPAVVKLPLPADFQPGAVSAISESEFWVLGTTACVQANCRAAVLHTVDGGQHFTRLATPASLAFGPPAVSDIRFAGPNDGWVFGPSIWSTHDAGGHWARVNMGGNVSRLEPGSGAVYALVTDSVCTKPGCGTRLVRTSPGSDSWSLVGVPGGFSGLADIAVHGSSLWVMYNGASAALWVSHDRGVTFSRHGYPCDPSLGGSLTSASDSVIWAFCATGTQGHPLISSNDGQTFSAPGSITSFPNGAVVAPLSAQRAFIASSAAPLRVTRDDGATWQSALAASQPGFEFAWVGFTDASVGYAVERFTGDSGGLMSKLWRTTDGGSSWSAVHFVQ